MDCTRVHAIPLALATLSTNAAAINSFIDPFSLIFGPPCRCYSPVSPTTHGSRRVGRQEYHKHPRSPAPQRHNARRPRATPDCLKAVYRMRFRRLASVSSTRREYCSPGRTKRGSIHSYKPYYHSQFGTAFAARPVPALASAGWRVTVAGRCGRFAQHRPRSNSCR